MVIELFVNESSALKAAKLDVDFMVATMKSLLQQVVTAEAKQEEAKRRAKESTEKWLTIKKKSYVTVSGYLDMAIAAVSKDSSAAKNFRKIRTSLTRRNKDGQLTAEPVKA